MKYYIWFNEIWIWHLKYYLINLLTKDMNSWILRHNINNGNVKGLQPHYFQAGSIIIQFRGVKSLLFSRELNHNYIQGVKSYKSDYFINMVLSTYDSQKIIESNTQWYIILNILTQILLPCFYGNHLCSFAKLLNILLHSYEASMNYSIRWFYDCEMYMNCIMLGILNRLFCVIQQFRKYSWYEKQLRVNKYY